LGKEIKVGIRINFLKSNSTSNVDTSSTECVVGEVTRFWKSAVPVSGGKGGLVSAGLESLKHLFHGPGWVLGDEDANSSRNVWGGHGSSRHGDVVVSTSSAGNDVTAWSRNLWFPVSSNGSTGREGAHGIRAGGRSNTNEALLISWRVGSPAAGSRVSKSKNWDDHGTPPGGDDLIVPSGSGSTSPGVGDNIGLGVGSGHEFTTSDKIGLSSRSLVVKTTAADPSGARSDTDTVGTSGDGSSAVRSVSVNIRGSGGVCVWVQPSSSISLGEGSVSNINSGVDNPSNAAGSVVDHPSLRGTDLSDSPLSILCQIARPFPVVNGGRMNGGRVLGTKVEGSWSGGELGKGFSRESLDEEDVGSPELFNLESEGVGYGNEGSLGGGGGPLKSSHEGGDTSITRKGLERGGGKDAIDDGRKFDDGFGALSSLDGGLEGDVKGAGGGYGHKGGDD